MLPEFPDFSPEEKDGKFLIHWSGEHYTFYTNRSGSRDLAAFKEAIGQSKPGHTPILVAPYIDVMGGLFQSSADFVFIAPFSYSLQPPADARYVGDPQALIRFINTIEDQQKFAIHIPPQWRAAGHTLGEIMRSILERAAVRLKTIKHFGRLWPVNFGINSLRLADYGDIAELKKSGLPDALVMAGPSLDRALAELGRRKNIWCADTALRPLVAHGIFPRVVFSVDAGFASREHFVGTEQATAGMTLVCDLLGSPAVQRLRFRQILTYAASHPLVQEINIHGRLTPVENPRGDVGSLMKAVHALLFGAAPQQAFGHDGKHREKITHARGTAYFYRSHVSQNRLSNAETYMLRLSRRYA